MWSEVPVRLLPFSTSESSDNYFTILESDGKKRHQFVAASNIEASGLWPP